jgi:hypothetical protein
MERGAGLVPLQLFGPPTGRIVTSLKLAESHGLLGRLTDTIRVLCPSNKPILVTGAHRSGSTWVGRMIASHWRVKYYSEPFNPEHADCPTCVYFHYMTPEDEPRFIAYLKPAFQLRSLGESGTSRLKSHHTAWRLGKSACRSTFCRLGGRPLFKDPMALLSAEWLAHRLGTETIVLIRHPAAFASSLKRLNWHFPFADFLGQTRLMEDHLEVFRGAIEQFAHNPPDIVDQSILLWRILHSVIQRYRSRHPDWRFVRHEDISVQPMEEFGKLFRALGLSFTPRVARTITEYTDGDNPAEAMEGVVHQLKRDSRGNIWNWTHRLSRDEILRIRSGTEDVAQHFYAPSYWNPPAPVKCKVYLSRPRFVFGGLRAFS